MMLKNTVDIVLMLTFYSDTLTNLRKAEELAVTVIRQIVSSTTLTRISRCWSL